MFLFDIYCVFICRAQQPLGNDRSNFLRCCMARSRIRLPRSRWLERLSRRLSRRRLTWSSSPLGAWGPRGGSRGVVGVVVQGWWWGHCPDGGRPATVTTNQLLVIWILILFKFNFVWSNKFNLCRLWRSLLAPSAQSLEDRTVIHPVGERQWKDINWNGQGHRSCANMELGTFCQLLYPDMVHVGDRWEVAHSWTHWALRQYVDQGSFQNVVKKMFWVSLVDKFQILFVFIFTCEFNSFLHTRTFLFGRWS
jgi:hypothetical protein